MDFQQVWDNIKKFFNAITAWLARRWLRNIVFGALAFLPFIVYVVAMEGTNNAITVMFFVLLGLGSIFISLGTIGFWVMIVRKIYFFFKYR